jgi:hypothetical protein
MDDVKKIALKETAKILLGMALYLSLIVIALYLLSPMVLCISVLLVVFVVMLRLIYEIELRNAEFKKATTRQDKDLE